LGRDVADKHPAGGRPVRQAPGGERLVPDTFNYRQGVDKPAVPVVRRSATGGVFAGERCLEGLIESVLRVLLS
jgi:hypothetical protein